MRQHDQTSAPEEFNEIAPRGSMSVVSVQAWLPPGLTAAIAREANDRNAGTASQSLGALGVYVLVAGSLLGIRLRAEFRGENLGEAPGRRIQDKAKSGWFISGSGPVSAQIEKGSSHDSSFDAANVFRLRPHAHGLCHRKSISKWGIVHPAFVSPCAAGLHCIWPAWIHATHVQQPGRRREGNSDALPLSGSYSYCTSRQESLSRNALCLVALGAGILAVLRMGRPSAVIVATTIGWLAFALPANLAAGNLLSLTMAYRVNLGRIGRQSGSQANALLSMVIQTMILGVGATVISLCGIFDEPWWAPPALFLLACASVLGWVLVLRHADSNCLSA